MSTATLFDWAEGRRADEVASAAKFFPPPAAPPPARYPHAPAFRDTDTSEDAAASMADRAPTLEAAALWLIEAAGAAGLTADEVAARLNESPLSIRPRVSTLLTKRLVVDSGLRRRNASGRAAIAWVAA